MNVWLEQHPFIGLAGAVVFAVVVSLAVYGLGVWLFPYPEDER